MSRHPYIKDNVQELWSEVEFGAREKRLKKMPKNCACCGCRLWISYSRDRVDGWNCQNKLGARTVGCCAHIGSVLWAAAFVGGWTDKSEDDDAVDSF